ncbi:GyrI-like domain-containing protein [Paenibacillus nasutitermitis]|uniref:AraC effector-binding domain-containing protein n=1 Tax=Paenibacillus nasutitermitis TaxID=1652958 RepID=A0A916ZBT2_9BACL|nr:GyrI-like domain-containing protein [Paenibacillus nasutitermitis]GGD86899.1 hypothetical protein GCM10010911_51670 [Paenibacillus nasutitermitis]
MSSQDEIQPAMQGGEVKVVVLPELKLVGIRVVAGDAKGYEEQIPLAFERLQGRLSEIAVRVEPLRLYGAYYASDESGQEDGYWACAEVEESLVVPEGMESVTVPPQSYAVIEHRGPIRQVYQTYEQLHRWIADKGYKRILRAWHLERYEVAEDNTMIIHLHDTITVD